MKQTSIILLSVLPFAFFIGCSRAASFHSMDTFMSIEQWGGRNVVKKCRAEVTRLEKLLSATNENSVLVNINRATESGDSKEVIDLLKYSLHVAKVTNGAFNPCMRNMSLLWGFTTKKYKVPTNKEIIDTLRLCDYKSVTFNGGHLSAPNGLLFDLGGIAKGYAGDRIIEILKGAKASGALVNLGGNVVVYGAKEEAEGGQKETDGTWSIGIRNPKQSGICGVLKVSGVANDGRNRALHVITSGGYERFFEVKGKRYCHIIGRNGHPVDNDLLSVTVISESGAEADSMATALFVMGSREALEYCHDKKFSYIMICKSGDIIKSCALDFTLTSDEYRMAKCSKGL